MGYQKTIRQNPTLEKMVEVIPDIVFSKEGGEERTLQLLSPWWDRLEGEVPAYPLVVFVQGSGWTFPNVWYQVPQLAMLAREGYVVATVTHRNSEEGHPFPACLQDVKTAIRFLRCHAKMFGIDASRVGLWGTSSGANLSLLCVLTEGQERYQTQEYREYSDAADYCVACFPPTDLVESMQDPTFDAGLKQVFHCLSADAADDRKRVLKEMSPYHLVRQRVSEGRCEPLVPIFLAHGDEDRLIPFRQSEKLYEAFSEYGADVSFVKVEGAPHEGAFWSQEMLELIFAFIKEHTDCAGRF